MVLNIFPYPLIPLISLFFLVTADQKARSSTTTTADLCSAWFLRWLCTCLCNSFLEHNIEVLLKMTEYIFYSKDFRKC